MDKEALPDERSASWQVRWIAGVGEGLAQAERGEFVSDEELAAVLNRHGPG